MRLSPKIFPALLAIILCQAGGVVAPLRASTNADAMLPPAMSKRLTIAILGFENKTGDSSNAFWRFAADGLIEKQLGEVKSLRILPSVDYALRQLKEWDGDALDAVEAGKAGRFIEARRVVWGSYQRIGEKWVMTAHVLNPATGKVSGDLKAASSDWFEIGDQITDKVLKELGTRPTSIERKKMSRRFTKSPVAFAIMARVAALNNDKAPLRELEKCIREAVSADPSDAEAQLIMASILFNQGKLKEAEETARVALKLRSDYAAAQLLLGVLLAWDNDYQNSERALLEAARLDPDDFLTWRRLGEVRWAQKDPAGALGYFEQALQLNPFSANVHARIGNLCAVQGRRDQAMAELKKAEQLASGDDVGEEQSLGEGFDALHEFPSAMDHYQKMITQGKKEGVNPAAIDGYEAREKDLKNRLTPVYVTAAQPKDYTEESLAEALHQKLNAGELAQVTNPLACTTEMTRWARQLTTGATNDLERAKMLFDALIRHVSDGPVGRRRTAKETFTDWNTPGAPFYCQEYAFLYVALSRAVGLKSYDVYVEEECDGGMTPHACAAVCLDNKVLLVDPTYYWFGVPHKKFHLQDDVQATAIYLTCQAHRLELAQIAAKLYPDVAFAQFNLGYELNSAGRWPEALKALSVAIQLDEQAWGSDWARATIAFHDEKIEAAIEYLQKVIKKNPGCGEAYVALGSACWKQGKLADARSNYRRALDCLFDGESADQTRYAIAQINELLGDSSPTGQAGPSDAMDFMRSGDEHGQKGELAKAVDDYDKAIQLNPKSAAAYFHRAYTYYLLKKPDRALDDCNAAIQLDPNQVHAYEYRGNIYIARGEYAEALGDYREAARLNSGDSSVYRMIAWILDNKPGLRADIEKEAIKAATKACELSEWKNSPCLTTLASAYAKAGDLDQAIDYQTKALSMLNAARSEEKSMREWLAYWQDLRQSRTTTKATNEILFATNLLTSATLQLGSVKPEADPDISKLIKSAESGDAAAQARFADYLYDGKHGLTANRVEAYKWASVAASSGDKTASYLVRDFELLMSADDLSAGKAAASAYLKAGKDRKE
ncbi:MAG: Tetratricopeptide 2 repeat protein [Pedosphaera sp.]|nr:Tetratricopeptide 2 repeat protein [Pedosphaera sp.]